MHTSEIANGWLSSRRAVVRVADRCSGTLVRPNVVLTAAHCVCSEAEGCLSQTTAKFIDVPNTGGHSSPIQGTVIPHPLYVPADPPVGEDLALVVLSQWPTQLDYEVSPIRIAGLNETVSVGDTVTFAGIGRTGDDCEHDNLVTRYEATATVDGFGSFAGSLVEIRVDDDSHVCPGDSGGPLLNAAGRIVGVTSRSAGNSSRIRTRTSAPRASCADKTTERPLGSPPPGRCASCRA